MWDVWDREDGSFDLTKLLCGSQGTLGLITDIKFRLIKPNRHSTLLVIFLREEHMRELGSLVEMVRGYDPESFEMYDNHTFAIIRKVLPDLIDKLGVGIVGFARRFIPEIKMMITGGVPKLVLLAEFTGYTLREAKCNARKVMKRVANEYDCAMHITRDKYEIRKYWTIRRDSFDMLRKYVKGKHTAPFIEDVCVRVDKLPDFLPKLYEILDEYDITYTIAGHIGSGNMHIIPLMDFSDKDIGKIIQELNERVFSLVFEYGGTMSAEHNDGLIRTPYLKDMYGEDVVKLFEQVKNIFDPYNIFNPGKKVGGDKNLVITSLRSYSF